MVSRMGSTIAGVCCAVLSPTTRAAHHLYFYRTISVVLTPILPSFPPPLVSLQSSLSSLYPSGPDTRMSRLLLGLLFLLYLFGQLFGTFAEEVFALVPGLSVQNNTEGEKGDHGRWRV